jgi:hypothetical protein
MDDDFQFSRMEQESKSVMEITEQNRSEIQRTMRLTVQSSVAGHDETIKALDVKVIVGNSDPIAISSFLFVFHSRRFFNLIKAGDFRPELHIRESLSPDAVAEFLKAY